MTFPTIIIVIIISIITIQSPIIGLFNYTLCKKEIPEFSGKKTYPLTSLNELKNLDDLSKFSLCAPNETDHEKGKQLILLALKGDPENSPDWVLSYGLLGTSMLNIPPLEKAAYKSFFLALNNFNFYKMTENQNLMFLANDPIVALNNTQSIITKRELIILGISRHIHNRFSYSITGDSKKIYSSDKNRGNHGSLKALFAQGLILHNKIKEKKINDHNLQTALGMAYSVLKFDNITVSDIDISLLADSTIYQESLKITLNSLKDRPTHGYKFLIVLNSKMNHKKLPVTDTFLFSKKQLIKPDIINLINQDIDLIEIKDLNNKTPKFSPTLNQINEIKTPTPKQDEETQKNTNKTKTQNSEKKQDNSNSSLSNSNATTTSKEQQKTPVNNLTSNPTSTINPNSKTNSPEQPSPLLDTDTESDDSKTKVIEEDSEEKKIKKQKEEEYQEDEEIFAEDRFR